LIYWAWLDRYIGFPPKTHGTGSLLLRSSFPGQVRTQVRRKLVRILRAKGYAPAVMVLNAYKPGLSWLREIVQLALEAIPRLERVRIAFREFAPECASRKPMSG
jgi:hypothetical protein